MKIEINIPEGYEIDKENSTWDNILLKEKIKYKIGDWVKLKKGKTWSPCGKMDYLLNKTVKLVKSVYDDAFRIENTNWNVWEDSIERLATEQEIREAEWKPGELYWVKTSCEWYLRFASMKYSEFYFDQQKSGRTNKWKEFQLAEGVSLPS